MNEDRSLRDNGSQSPEQKRPLKIGILRRTRRPKTATTKPAKSNADEEKLVKDEPTSSEPLVADQDQTLADVKCVVCSTVCPFSATLPVPKQIRERSSWSEALGISLTYRDRICRRHFSPDQIVMKVYRGNMIPHVRRGTTPKLLPSSESINEEIVNITPVSQKRRRQSVEFRRSGRRSETLVIPNEEMIDRGYYYVKRSRKQRMAVTPEASSPSDEDSESENPPDGEDEECPTLECPPIAETVEGFCKIERSDTSSESETEPNLNGQSSKDAITSINDLLSSALLDVDQPGSFTPVADEISFNKNFISNECSKITCRQLSSRLSLLQRERERLNRLRDLLVTEVDLLQQRVEKMTDGGDSADATCLSCADGRLEAFFQSNLARVKMLREKAAQLRQNVGLK